jgi:hypothetical protein
MSTSKGNKACDFQWHAKYPSLYVVYIIIYPPPPCEGGAIISFGTEFLRVESYTSSLLMLLEA